jgi:hypothetical protein
MSVVGHIVVIMPFTAQRLDGTRVVAPDLTVREMADLRATELVMPCCMSTASVVIPGNPATRRKHFRHRPPRTAPANEWCDIFDNRSEPHLRLQEAVYRLADLAGWEADIESVGPRRRWIADVLLTPPWVNRSDPFEGRIAVEIQLSPQAPEDYIYRTRRYREDGVSTVWLNGLGTVPHFETGYTQGSVVAGVVDREGEMFLTSLSKTTRSERPLKDLIGLLDGTIQHRSRHRIPMAPGLALPPGRPPRARPTPLRSIHSPGRLAPRRSQVLIRTPNLACRRPHEQAPGWYRVMFAEHLCSNCGRRALSWRPLTCGESGHPCEHAPVAIPADVELGLWTITTALWEPLTAGRLWAYSGVAHPLDDIDVWACPCGHQLGSGREITWETVGVQLVCPAQPRLF